MCMLCQMLKKNTGASIVRLQLNVFVGKWRFLSNLIHSPRIFNTSPIGEVPGDEASSDTATAMRQNLAKRRYKT